MLVKDPIKRMALNILVDDPWLNDGVAESPISLMAKSITSLDKDVITLLETRFKLEHEVVMKSLDANEYDDIGALYYLLQHDDVLYKKIESEVKTMGKEATTLFVPSPSTVVSVDLLGPLMGTINETGILQEGIKESGNRVEVHVERIRRGTVTGMINYVPKKEEKEKEKVEESQRRFTVTTLPNPKHKHKEAEKEADSPPLVDKLELLEHLDVVSSVKSIDLESSGPGEPRSLRFTFNCETTSSKAPDEIMREVVNACIKLKIVHKVMTKFLLECSSEGTSKEQIKFEVEVCKLPRLKNLHGLRFKRITGTATEYKDFCKQIIDLVKL